MAAGKHVILCKCSPKSYVIITLSSSTPVLSRWPQQYRTGLSAHPVCKIIRRTPTRRVQESTFTRVDSELQGSASSSDCVGRARASVRVYLLFLPMICTGRRDKPYIELPSGCIQNRTGFSPLQNRTQNPKFFDIFFFLSREHEA